MLIRDTIYCTDAGDDALRAMRSKGITTPVIMVTANALPAQVELYRSLGADDVVTKPWSLAVLKEAICAAIDNKKAKALPFDNLPVSSPSTAMQHVEPLNDPLAAELAARSDVQLKGQATSE